MSFASKFFNKTLGGVRDAFSTPHTVYHDKHGREYRVKKLLSDAGRFGQIYVAEDGADPTRHYAVKVLSLTSESKKAIQREATVMQKLAGHPNIVKLEAFFTVAGTGGNDAVFVMELCDGGSLLDVLNARAPRPFPEADLLSVFLEVCTGVAFMHSQKPPIAHRDIKIENVLRKGRTWKLCDFGSATTSAGVARDERTRQLMADDIERNTTMTYRAPEMCDLFRKQLVCEKADIWALGCMLYKMAFFADAFEDGTLQILNNRWSVPRTSPFSPRLHDLIRFMLEPDPARRPHIGLVCERTAQLLNRPNPVPNFVPYNHAAEVSGSPSAPRSASASTTATTTAPATAAAAPSGPKPAAAASKGDFFSMLAWVDDSNTPAPAPAPAHTPTAQARTPASTPTATPQSPSFFDMAATPSAAAAAPSQSPHQEEDFFAAFAASQQQQGQSPAPGTGSHPRRASGGSATLSPPPTRPAAVKAPEPTPAPAPAPSVAGCTSFFDNDFTPAFPPPPSSSASPAPRAASGSFWDNDFCAASPSPALSASASASTTPAVTPPPAATPPAHTNDALFSMLQPPLVPTITPPPVSPRRAHAPPQPRKPASTTVTAEPGRAATCEDHIMSAWKK